MISTLRNRAAAMAAAVFLAFWPVLAWAQNAPPQPKLLKSPPVWLGMIVMAVLLALVVMVSLMPSKRGHQD